ncbi:MAG: endonuclease/exonuclease/phosphatase family protein [Thermoanaerobaculia bacterium]
MRLLPLAVAIFLATGSSSHPPASPLRVMTYNIHAGKDAGGVDNLARVADVIAKSDAEIVLLQEVDRNTARSGNVDQAAELERLTGFHAAFGKSLDYQGGEYGIAILSHWPITRATTVHLPVEPTQTRAGESTEPRVALVIETKTPLGALTVVDTHLDASRDDRYRLQEVRELVSLVGEQKSSDILVGGDFNSTPTSRIHEVMIGSGLRDAWSECASAGEGATYPADTPRERIDYLYLGDAFHCAAATVLETRASDHRPLLVELR